jgi:hypothetical protein
MASERYHYGTSWSPATHYVPATDRGEVGLAAPRTTASRTTTDPVANLGVSEDPDEDTNGVIHAQ